MKAGTRETHLELLCLCENEPLTCITRLISTSLRLTSYPPLLTHSLPLPSPSYSSPLSSLPPHTITPFPIAPSPSLPSRPLIPPTLSHPTPRLTLVVFTILVYLFPVP
ncbi:hypothetical protein Pmani_012775 [Petrolisthes manimaculis]|uniref:Uncharacterized protein n=1 Tax=Petrolisthes manimaculis TaxID=1843537 RepID=A0AAE1PYE7_9EUCA|nr:hypothetical protein Pmani_012775 [Petrolisthes manimaculis]